MHAQHNANAGTKGAAKAMNKIAQGPLYKEGTTCRVAYRGGGGTLGFPPSSLCFPPPKLDQNMH